MTVTVTLLADSSADDVLHLFANELQAKGVGVAEVKVPGPSGTRGTLTTAISIGSLAVASLALFINVAKYFWDRKPKYSITIKRGDVSVTLGNVSSDKAVKMLQAAPSDATMLMEIRRDG